MAENVRGSTLCTQGSEPFYDLFCQPCSEDKRHLEAYGFCQDCQEYLCQDCYDSHRKPRPTRHHCLLNKDEMPKTPPPSTVRTASDGCTQSCKKHPKEIIKYHCPKHDDVVCGVCVTLSHITCGVTYIPDLASGIGESDEYKKLNQALLNFAEKTQENINLAKKNMTSVQRNYNDALYEVQQVRKEINEMMDLLESRIKVEADVFKSADNEKMNAMIRNCENLLREAKCLRSRLKTMEDQKQEYNLFLEMKKSREELQLLQDKINDLQENNNVTHFVFERSDDLWDFVNNTSTYGKLLQKGRSKQDSSATTIDHVTDMSFKLTQEKGRQAPVLTGAVVMNGDTLVAVEAHSQYMYVFDTQKFTRKHIAKLYACPWDITRVGKESVALTTPMLQTIFCYTVSDDVNLERKFSTHGKCHGIAYQRECFYVTFCDTDARIEVLDRTGKTLTKIDSFGNRKFVWPIYISVRSNALLVSDSRYGGDFGSVIKIQKSGQLEWIYIFPELAGPRGLIVDQHGSVIVCAERSNTIHMLSPDGKCGRVLLSLKGPQVVTFCKFSGRLFVAQDPFDKLRVYKMH